jgi:hypothetical protein
MTQKDVDAPGDDDGAENAADADINMVTILVVLAVLVGLVALMFWAIPSWFGSTTITVNPRG